MDVENLYLMFRALSPRREKQAELIKQELKAAKDRQRWRKKPEEMRVALYVRKSNERDERQQHSKEDQKRDCLAWAARNGITIREDDIIEEDGSARYAGNRPKFIKMLTEVVTGKYDAILAYHPDRLARSMLEAGIILDMLKPIKKDKKPTTSDGDEAGEQTEEEPPVLQALFFPTVEFTNDSGGRLMLAVLFSMATQYSDHLSEVVQRGIDSHHEAGKSNGARKWGYIRSAETGMYEPDENWELIRKGWEKFLAGSSQVEVLDYWKLHKVKRTSKPKGDGSKPNTQYLQGKNSVHTILTDPFYYGMNRKRGSKPVDLREKNPNFKPMVTKEEFEKVQKILKANYQVHRQRKDNPLFLPLRDCVYCANCRHKMTPAAVSNGRNMNYKVVSYNCRNKDCMAKAGIRGKAIFQHIYKTLDTLKIGDEAYEEYVRVAKQYATKKAGELSGERDHLNGLKSQADISLKNATKKLSSLVQSVQETGDEADKEALKQARKEVKGLKSEINEYKKQIAEFDEQIKDPEMIVLKAQAFSNLLKTAANEMRKRNWTGKDQLFRMIFSNLLVNNKKEVFLICKPELKDLLSMTNVIYGGVTGIQTLDLRLAKAAL